MPDGRAPVELRRAVSAGKQRSVLGGGVRARPQHPGGEHAIEQRLHQRRMKEPRPPLTLEANPERVFQRRAHRRKRGESPAAPSRASPSRAYDASSHARSFGSANAARCDSARVRYSPRPAPTSRAKARDVSSRRTNVSASSASRNVSSFVGRPAASSPTSTKSRVFVTSTNR